VLDQPPQALHRLDAAHRSSTVGDKSGYAAEWLDQRRTLPCLIIIPLFACLLQHLLIEAFPKEEAGLVPEGVEPRPDLLDDAEPLRLEQNAQYPECTKTQAGRCMAGLLLIKEYDLGLQLDRKGKGFSFPSIEITS
jgi:hypothetical protein